MADFFKELLAAGGNDYSGRSTSEIIDTVGYFVFPGVDPSLGAIFDQDTGNMGWMQEGMGASRKQTATLANYQESRIRHIHQTLDKYLGLAG